MTSILGALGLSSPQLDAVGNIISAQNRAVLDRAVRDHRRRPPRAPHLPYGAGLPVAWWGDDPDAWDTVLLDGVSLPGVCRVDAALERKVDSTSPPGSDGGTVRDKGYGLAKFKVTVTLWTREHLAFWVRLGPLLDPRRRGRERRPTRIEHPALAGINITQAYLTGVTALRPAHPKGSMEATLSFIEFAPATAPARSVTKTATATPPADAFALPSAKSAAGAPATTPADDNAGPEDAPLPTLLGPTF